MEIYIYNFEWRGSEYTGDFLFGETMNNDRGFLNFAYYFDKDRIQMLRRVSEDATHMGVEHVRFSYPKDDFIELIEKSISPLWFDPDKIEFRCATKNENRLMKMKIQAIVSKQEQEWEEYLRRYPK